MPTSDRNKFRLRGVVRWQKQEQTANGKDFVKLGVETDGAEDREFQEGDGPPVFETIMVVAELFGRAYTAAVQIGVGSEVEMVGYLTSREFNEKWYQGFRVTGLRVLTAVAQVRATAPGTPAVTAAVPNRAAEIAKPDPMDDIPF